MKGKPGAYWRPNNLLLMCTILSPLYLTLVTGSEAPPSQPFPDTANIEEGLSFRNRRSAPAPWIRQLTPAEQNSIKSGWLSFGQPCDSDKDRNAQEYFLNTYNSGETVTSFLEGTHRDKSGVCDFLNQNLFCSVLFRRTCLCSVGSSLVGGQCKIVEGGFDCEDNWYDKELIDDPTRDSRAGLLGPHLCTTGTTCTKMDELRPTNDDKQEIYVCKPNTPGFFPETKQLIKKVVLASADQLPFLAWGKTCKVHLNTHHSVSSHVYDKEQAVQNFWSSRQDAPGKCNVLKHQECERLKETKNEPVCICAFGFGLEGGECRLAGSPELDEATVRRCEWELWPDHFISNKLLELEQYVPESLEIQCMTNASCRLSTDGQFRSCQCDPGKVCSIPKRHNFTEGNGTGRPNRSSVYFLVFMFCFVTTK